MPISVTCPKCEEAYNLPENLAGKKVKCQKCQGPISVPAPKATNTALGKKTQAPKVTSIAAGGAKTPKKADPDKSPKSAGKGAKKKTPAKAKSGGSMLIFVLMFLLGGGLLACCGGGIGAWWMYGMSTDELKAGPVAVNDKKDAVKPKDGPVPDGKKDKAKKDDAKKDAGPKDKGGPSNDGKKDDAKKDDAKKDDSKKDDAKKDDAKKDDSKKDDGAKDGPPKDGKQDGPPKGGDPFKGKDAKGRPTPAYPLVKFDGDGTFTANAVVDVDDPLDYLSEHYKGFVVEFTANTTYEIELKRASSSRIRLTLLDDTQKRVADTDTRVQASRAIIVYQPTRSGRHLIQASDSASRGNVQSPFTLSVRRCEDLMVGPGFRINYRLYRFKQPADRGKRDLVGDLVWASDGKSFLSITNDGILRKTDVVTGAVEEKDFRQNCTALVQSAEGVLLMMKDAREIWILDPADFKTVRKKIAIPGPGPLASGADAKVAFVWMRGGAAPAGINVIDLQKGAVVGTIESRDITSLRTTRDGTFIFAAEGMRKILRYRWDGSKIALEETSDELVDFSRDLRISPDDQLVWLQGGNPKNGKDALVFHVSNLKQSTFALAPGERPTAIGGIDSKGGHFFSMLHPETLAVLSPTGHKRATITIPLLERHPGTESEVSVAPAGHELLIRGSFDVAYIKINNPGEPLARLDPKVEPKDPKIDPKDPKVDPKEPKKDPPIVAKDPPRPLEQKDITHRVFKSPDAPLRNPVWAADGKSFIILQQNGKLQRINTETGMVEKEHALVVSAGPDAALALSAEGLVASLPLQRQVWVIDPDDFTMVKKRIGVLGVGRLAAAPEGRSAVVSVAGAKTNGLRVLDLTTGDAGPTIPFPLSALNMKMSPDGKYVYFADKGRINRYRVEGTGVIFEENTPFSMVQTPASLHISPDSYYVGFAGSISAPPPGYPGRELFVFQSTALKKPAFTLPKLDFPRAVAVDTAGSWVYTNDTKRPLIVYSMAGVKQGEWNLSEVDAATSFEFVVSPLGREFLIRSNASITHVRVAAWGVPPVGRVDPPVVVNPKVDPPIGPKVDPPIVNPKIDPKNAFKPSEDVGKIFLTKTHMTGNMKAKEFSFGFGNTNKGLDRPDPVWEPQGRWFYAMPTAGDVLYKVSREGKVEAAVTLPNQCNELALTSEGLITKPVGIPQHEVWLIDPQSLALCAKIPCLDPSWRLLASPQSPVVVLETPFRLSVLDLRTRKHILAPVIQKDMPGILNTPSIVMSPDGKRVLYHNFTTGEVEHVFVGLPQLTYLPAKSVPAGTKLHLAFTADSKFVAYGLAQRGLQDEGKGLTVDVYSLANLAKPAYTIQAPLQRPTFDSQGRLYGHVGQKEFRCYPNPATQPGNFQVLELDAKYLYGLSGARGSGGCLFAAKDKTFLVEP